MASLVIAGVAEAGGWSLFATAAAAAAGSLIDSYAIGNLFGGRDKKLSYGSVSIQGADEGTPYYRCFGPYCRIPCAVVYASPPISRTSGGSSGKRQEPVQITWYSDLLIAMQQTDQDVHIQRVLADGGEVIDFRSDYSEDFSLSAHVDLAHDRRQIRGAVYRGPNPTYYRLDYWHLFIETKRNADLFAIQSASADSSNRVILTTALNHGKSVGATFYVRVNNFRDTSSSFHIDENLLHWATATSVNTIRIEQDFDYIFPSGAPTAGVASSIAFLKEEVLGTAGQTTQSFMQLDVGKPVGLEYNPGTGPAYTGFTCVARENVGGDIYRLILDIDDGGDSGFPTSDRRYWGYHPVRPRAPANGTDQRTQLPPNGDYAYPIIPAAGGTLRVTQTRDNYKPGAAASWEIPYFSSGGKSTQQPQSNLISAAVGAHLLPAYRPLVTVAAKDYNLSTHGNRLPNFELLGGTQANAIADAITEICEEWGFTPDVSSVTGDLRGIQWSGKIEASQILQPLMLAYDIVAQETADSVKFFPRSAAAVYSVTTDVMLPRADGKPVAIERDDDARRLQSITVNFADFDHDFLDGSIVERARGKSSGEDETLTLPLTLTSDEARAIGLRILRASHLNVKVAFSLPPTYADIAENDVLSFTHEERTLRVRLTKIDVAPDWSVAVEGVLEPDYAKTSSVDSDGAFGESRYGGGEGDRIGITPLAFEVFTSYSFRDGESAFTGYYVAAVPWQNSPGYAGSWIYHSIDNGVSWKKVGSCPPANLGYLEGDGIPAAGATDSLDSSSEIVVSIAGGGEVSSTTTADAEAGVANLALVGDELMNFVDGVLEADGTYAVSNLFRGRQGTTVTSHIAGERFLVIDDGVCYVPLQDYETGLELQVKVVPQGGDIDDFPARTITIPASGDATLTGEYVVTGFSAFDTKDGPLLIWNEVDQTNVDYYEIRRGSRWGAAPLVWRGSHTWVALRDVAPGSRTYWIRAHFDGGMYGAGAVSATITPSTPDGETSAATLTDLISSASGTPSGCAYNITDNRLEMNGGEYTATYTTTVMDAGSVANWLWTLEVDFHEVDLTAVDDLTDRCDSMAAAWRTVDTSEPWDVQPGADFDDVIEDVDGPSGDLTRPTYGPEWGSYGRNTRVKVEARFDTTGAGAWTSYEEFHPGHRTAQKMQVRLTMDRRATTYSLRVDRLQAEARA